MNKGAWVGCDASPFRGKVLEAVAIVSPLLDLKLLILLFVANGAPVIAKDILQERFQIPVDAGRKFLDGQPIFGHSKTIRGIFFSLVATAIATPLMGLSWVVGALVAGSAMAGDLLSSFLKRRLKYETSSRAVGIDQLPEALFPLLVCMKLLALTWVDVAAIAVAFVAAELLFSGLLYKWHIRDRPY